MIEGHTLVIPVEVVDDCLLTAVALQVGKFAYDPKVITPIPKKTGKSSVDVHVRGRDIGQSFLQIDFGTKAPCDFAFGLLFDVTVLPNPDTVGKEIGKGLKGEYLKARKELLVHAVDTSRELLFLSRDVRKKDADIPALKDEAFDVAHCGLVDLLNHAQAARDLGRNLAEALLSLNGLNEADKGPALSAGGCGVWDGFVHDLDGALQQSMDRVTKAHKQFNTAAGKVDGLFDSLFTSNLIVLPTAEPPRGPDVDPVFDLFSSLPLEMVATLTALTDPQAPDPGDPIYATLRLGGWWPDSSPDPGGPPPTVSIFQLNQPTQLFPVMPDAGGKFRIDANLHSFGPVSVDMDGDGIPDAMIDPFDEAPPKVTIMEPFVIN